MEAFVDNFFRKQRYSHFQSSHLFSRNIWKMTSKVKRKLMYIVYAKPLWLSWIFRQTSLSFTVPTLILECLIIDELSREPTLFTNVYISSKSDKFCFLICCERYNSNLGHVSWFIKLINVTTFFRVKVVDQYSPIFWIFICDILLINTEVSHQLQPTPPPLFTN